MILSFCCSEDPGYIKKGVGSHSDVEVPDLLHKVGVSIFSSDHGTGSNSFNVMQDPLLNTDLNSNPIWTGNWSQLCPTCKVCLQSCHFDSK